MSSRSSRTHQNTQATQTSRTPRTPIPSGTSPAATGCSSATTGCARADASEQSSTGNENGRFAHTTGSTSSRSSGRTSLHVAGTSLLHRLHPFTKLAWVLFTGMVAYLAPGGFAPAALLLAINILLVPVGGVMGPCWAVAWRTLLPLALFMLPIHGLLYPGNVTPLFAIHGLTVYVEGVGFAGLVLVRLSAVLIASLLFVLTTDPADFLTALTDAGVSPSMAWLLGSPMLMLPAMRARVSTIQAAQRARGLDSEGGMLRRFRAIGPMVAPFVLGAFSEIEQRAIALEVRGFSSTPKHSSGHSGGRTSWRIVPDSTSQRVVRWGLLLSCVVVVGYKVWVLL